MFKTISYQMHFLVQRNNFFISQPLQKKIRPGGKWVKAKSGLKKVQLRHHRASGKKAVVF